MNKLLKASAVYGIVSSACMLLLWGGLFLSGAARDILGAGTVSTAALLLDEALTSAGLMIGGIGLLKKKQWAPVTYYASMGMLLYAVVFAAGKFAGTAYAALSVLFILVAAATAVFLCLHCAGRRPAPGEPS